ncbi:hypothetical protein EYE40_14555 [Glaciihabitans arcticus]|uniref:DUF559 domain-containing protein n=1 Tax=Glaciihabitans arcticus TaxID=2668039 RepID=A0A4V6MTL9_9MICO|nr:hypothetical protein [Glaciihabitans arcticus]TBN55426.1 hypothetical protein EYE40_14555 [Glaciihabitans arcticus]
MKTELRTTMQSAGGLIRTSTLRRLGFTRRDIEAGLKERSMTRVFRPWVALRSAERDAIIAVSHHGRLTNASALGSYGVWRGLDRAVHVLVPRTDRGAATAPPVSLEVFVAPEHPTNGVVRHWGGAPPGNREWRVPPIHALASFALTQSAEMFVAAVDSALHEKVVKPSDMPELRALLPRRLRRLLDLVDERSEAGCESLARLRLAPLSRSIDIQVQIGPHRVDLLVDGWLIIEIDSEKWHSGTRVADSRRDTDLIRRGYRIKHFDYSEVIYEWPKVEASIIEMLRNPPATRPARTA